MTSISDYSTSNKIPNILIIGVGGVGSIIAYGLDYNKKSNVSILVRSDYTKVVNSGYTIDSCDYGFIKNWKPNCRIFPDIQSSTSLKPYDYIIIATKNLPDIINFEKIINPIVDEKKTTIILFQNGFGNEVPYLQNYPNNIILSGISHIGSHNINTFITQTQKDKSFISYFYNKNIPLQIQNLKTNHFISIYSNEKNDVNYFPDAQYYRYRKLVYNASLNTVCALTGVDTGRLEFFGGLDKISIPIMYEIIGIAKADNVELPSDVINSVVHSDDGDYFQPSMLVDVKKGNPMELEVILGNLLRKAKYLNVDCPKLSFLYDLLQIVQFRLKENRCLIPPLPEKRPIYKEKFYS
ncbi:ketopantoate reductase family protein [Ascoidea rubescens DSM 1968]|uniref:6-phosphogluconate dehydrogenase C-terminal domain-like protein n=1 Tax=Ascoidea rubescens DSM 1968 TaxID=1344418 RepID=A0A1D2V879_9ASCO|nr:6-phosphogluconate dehydrogenase C-terminal domain-like protein [Ascoidea rubescens DSM 1968]ODV57844.1 6-phosphogluconate dehydrogenase C-terminal domain-like protein [Ascoidea rubescens DSM 1968]